MKLPTVVIAIFLMAAGVCQAEGITLVGRSQDYTAKIVFLNKRPIEGENKVQITLLDKSSRPVTNAQIKVEYDMPSSPGRPSMMDYHTSTSKVDGIYDAVLDLDMKGEWRITLSIVRDGHTEKTSVLFLVK